MKSRHAVVSSKMRRRRRTIRVLAVVVVVALLLGVSGFFYVQYRYGQIRRVTVNGLTTSASTGAPENILLVGNNSRCALTKYSQFYNKQSSHFGTCSQVGGGRSDVTMVLHLDPAKHSAYLLSIPRDLWLPMPGGHGLQLRVDDALNTSETPYLHLPFGPTLLVNAIQQDLGIPINHYVELNFYTFEQVVKTLGGITLNFPTQLRDHYSGLNITFPGCQHLNGTQALALVRARHLYYNDHGVWKYDGTGDLGRIIRTHIFLRALAAQTAHTALSNPIKANALLGAILPNLKLDQGFGLSQLVSLALAYRHISPNGIPTATLPVIIPNGTFHDLANPSNYQAPGSVVLPFQPEDQTVINQFLGNTATNTSSISPSSITVSVYNAANISGQAAQVASQLKSLGYPINQVGNATYAGTTSETVVRYAPGSLAQGEKVLSDLQGEAILAQGSTSMNARVTVTLGTTVAVSPPKSGATAASTSTRTPSATTALQTTLQSPPQATAISSSSSTSPALQSVQNLARTNLWTATHPAGEFWWDPQICTTPSG
ncbi:MAG: LCP family protein [Ferrimicrobium sp.]